MEEPLARLERWFAPCPAAAIAFSGGVDSSLVAFLARRFLGRDRAKAYTSASPSLKRSDLELAQRFCAENDIPLEVIHTGELNNPSYAANPVDRCYYCKTTLYTVMAEKVPGDGSVWLLNGTNLDDHGDWRPGLNAAAEARVRSPLADCGVDKAAVRRLAADFDLACWDKPASPCLSSRIPYGQTVTLYKLQRIEAAEGLLNRLGFAEVRVRHHDDRAVVEVPADRLEALEAVWPRLVGQLEEIGFAKVELDPEGLVSGKLNRGMVP
jgi:uncharacterized protein